MRSVSRPFQAGMSLEALRVASALARRSAAFSHELSRNNSPELSEFLVRKMADEVLVLGVKERELCGLSFQNKTTQKFTPPKCFHDIWKRRTLLPRPHVHCPYC